MRRILALIVAIVAILGASLVIAAPASGAGPHGGQLTSKITYGTWGECTFEFRATFDLARPEYADVKYVEITIYRNGIERAGSLAYWEDSKGVERDAVGYQTLASTDAATFSMTAKLKTGQFEDSTVIDTATATLKKPRSCA